MRTDASLFAHIQNDAFLSGTWDLEGNHFKNTAGYLKAYMEALQSKGDNLDVEDLELLQLTDYLVKIEEQLSKCCSSEQVDTLAQSVVTELDKLPVGGKLLIPGGWRNDKGGHAMMYQLTREPHGYLFTVINSGDGLNYHAKKSSSQKELFNPLKTWVVPLFTTDKEQNESGHFIARLLKAQVLSMQQKPVDAKVLYEEILPSISYINGIEVDANKKLPGHAWTGAQLSGSCAQRVIHQALKINAESGEAYQRKIFKFKLYNLLDYVDQCLTGLQPFTPAVADQIRLSIENNLKLLNVPTIFNAIEKNEYFNKLAEIKNRVEKAECNDGKAPPKINSQPAALKISGMKLSPPMPLNPAGHDTTLPAPVTFHKGTLLSTLDNAIQDIQKIKDPVIAYACLEQLILALPMNEKGLFQSDVYAELNTLGNCKLFQQHILKIQTLLQNLQKKWFPDIQTPAGNHLALSVLALQMDIHHVIAMKEGLPSFKPFADQLMATLVANHERNPYNASNNALIDSRFSAWKSQYSQVNTQTREDFYEYLNKLIATEPDLDRELTNMYQKKFGKDVGELHQDIRQNRLEALYMIAMHFNNESQLAPRFNPVIEKVKHHVAYESVLRRAVNPFFEVQMKENFFLKLTRTDEFRVSTPLYPAHITFQKLSPAISKYKYDLPDSPALDALKADIPTVSHWQKPVYARTDNHIQLHPGKAAESDDTPQHVTQADILARDYFHLRTRPNLQIALTLDYFTRHIAMLADEANQRYVEANLFQPGLLANASKKPEFIPQFESFLKIGSDFFNQKGPWTRDYLVFLRLNFLVSRYLVQLGDLTGKPRLQSLQDDLLKQLSLAINPDVTYVMQQYLFLTIMARIDSGEKADDLFLQAFDAYFYLQSHTNPSILEDTSHRFELDGVFARFKMLANKQPEPLVKQAVVAALSKYEKTRIEGLKVTGTAPVYDLVDQKSKVVFQFKVFPGKLFDQGLARSGVPLAIQNHPLIKQEGLQSVRECFINADGNYMILEDQKKTASLFYNNGQLTIQKEWLHQRKLQKYELQALTANHLAKQANKYIPPIKPDLPKILTDGSMNYWQDIADYQKGLLVQNSIPVYSVNAGKIRVLDAIGNETTAQLSTLNPKWRNLLDSFESNDFILAHVGPVNTVVKLPRYDLTFEINTKSANPGLVCKDTGEFVSNSPSPIHPAVAGLALQGKEQARYLVPVARFYATELNAEQSDFHPLIHDTNGTIASACLEEHWEQQPPLQKPLWHYQKSEAYVSFSLKDGEPVADTVADALYLVYMYLATNQTSKAWKILEDCNTRLGGLTGDPAELKYISWICKELPHILPGTKSDAHRSTPPYVACQLKAQSLLCDYLSQDRTFDLKAPSLADNTANSSYALLQHERSKQFLTGLPETIYLTYGRLQRMSRHLEHTYQLSTGERKRLLDYYHQSQPKNHAPRGALGYEWMSLSLKALTEEHETLSARRKSKSLSKADEQRLENLESHFKTLKPVMSSSTALELVSIDLGLPANSKIKESQLSSKAIEILNTWQGKLPGASLKLSELKAAINVLSSNLDDAGFMTHFPALLQVACSSERALRKDLLDFCTATLLAKRHIPLVKQDSNSALLCNILYRVLNNSPKCNDYLNRQKDKSVNFAALVKETGSYTVPTLNVYQAKDVYEQILATAENIVASIGYKRSIPLSAPTADNIGMLAQLGIESGLSSLDAMDKAAFENILARYRQLADKHTRAIANLGKTLTNDLEHNADVEAEAGKCHLALEKHQKALAEELMKQPSLAKAVQKIVLDAESVFKVSMENAWKDALALAKQGPDDPEQARSWLIELTSGARAPINQAMLQSLYVRADLDFTMEKTGLSADNAKRLHQLIHSALVKSISWQTLGKIAKNLDTGKTTNDAMVALDLLAKAGIPALNEPAIVLLQQEGKILLRDRQVSALQSLLKVQENGDGFNETVEKIIMGGGKSKVILPILAEKKARGDNLVVIEVPQALLATNHVDLNRTSQRLFGKRAHRFEFNRDSNCTPERLEQLYRHFTDIMTSRDYLVTSGESVQSLELKYVELLLSSGEQNETWEKQVYWLDKITGLFRNQADCIIDEVHQGLSLKKKLNYTTGEPKSISPVRIKHATALYNLIDIEFIKKAPLLNADYDWSDFQNNLADKLVNNPGSPLSQFIRKAVLQYGEGVKMELVAYLANTADTMSKVLVYASAEDRSALAYFKQEIGVLLPETLSRRLDEYYGASKQTQLSPVEQTLAIPYAANNIPNERSRYCVETAINYTSQMMLLKGIGKELMMERIAGLQTTARQELFQDSTLKHIDDTPTARGFVLQSAGLGLSLSDIDVANSRQMAKVHAHLQHNQPLMFNCLEKSLKQIQTEEGIIHSDAFNHADQYRSLQGVSGTPEGTPCHQRLQYDRTASLGSDGYILELLLDKKTAISSLDYQNPRQYIKDTLSKSVARERTRAIIDIRAAFQGVSNLVVAKEIARYILTNPEHFNQAIQHVLYFNDDQILCAIHVDKPDKSIVLASSDVDEMNRLLGTKADERFTYYDQAHTFGADITQGDFAHALVFADDKTSPLQGSTRMRGLGQEQTLEYFVPSRLDGISVTDLFNVNGKADRLLLLQNNLVSAQAQMTNFIRRRSLSIVQDLPAEKAKEKAILSKHFRAFFEDRSSQDLFELYGAINTKQATTEILARRHKQLLSAWRAAMEKAGLAPSKEAEQLISEDLQKIIVKAIVHCLAEYKGVNDDLSSQLEIQKQVQKEVELQSLDESFNAKLTEATRIDWYAYVDMVYTRGEIFKQIAFSMNELCLNSAKRSDFFSSKLSVSQNYAQTYKNQSRHIGAFIKPVFLIWYHIQDDKLHAMIVTTEEADRLEQHLNNRCNSWIATTKDTVVAGNRPGGILDNEDYQSLREQVRFFNGELASLVEQDSPLRWLKTQTSEKLNFFTNSLQACRAGSAAEFELLNAALAKSSVEGFIWIATHPYDNFTDFDWTSVFPNAVPTQITECRKVAEAFAFLNKYWRTLSVLPKNFQQQFQLPTNSLEFVNKHFNQHSALKQLLQRLPQIAPEKPLLQNLSGIEMVFLEKNMGIPFDELVTQYDLRLPGIKPLNPVETANWQLADLHALKIFRTHPLLEDTSAIDRCMERIARQAMSVDVLLALLKITPLSDSILASIVTHPLCDEAVVSAIFALNIPLPARILVDLVLKCHSEEHVGKLLAQAEINDKVLGLLVERDELPEAQLLRIIACAKQDSIYIRVFEHRSATKLVREALLQHPSISPHVLRHCAGSCRSVDDELLLLKHPSITEDILMYLAQKEAGHSQMLLSLASHDKANQSVMKEVVGRFEFSVEIAQKILARTGEQIERSLLMEMTRIVLTSIAWWAQYEKYHPQSLVWDNVMLTLISHYHKLNQPSLLSQFLTPGTQKILSPRLGFAIFNLFGMGWFPDIPIKSLVVDADNDELRQWLRSDRITTLAEDVLIVLAQKCQGNLLDLFLEHKDIPERILLELLTRQNLNEGQLLRMLGHARSDGILEGIYNYPGVSTPVLEAFYGHGSLSSHLVLSMLNGKSLAANDMLHLLDHPTAITEQVLNVILLDERISPDVARKIANERGHKSGVMKQLALSIFKLMNAKPEDITNWEDAFIAMFKQAMQLNCTVDLIEIIRQNKVSPRLGFGILHAFGDKAFAWLPLNELIANVSDEDLDDFVAIEVCLTTENLSLLAGKVTKAHQIDALLARTEMTSSIADILFQKPEFSGKIGNWSWLSETQLLGILDKTSDFDSFSKALAHGNLSAAARDKWFEQMTQQHSEDVQNAAMNKEPKPKILAAIDGFKIKACSHVMKSLTDTNYAKVAAISFELYHALRHEVTCHFESGAPNMTALHQKCSDRIEVAMPVLQVHRGSKQALLDIVNVLLHCITLGFAMLGMNDWRFFKANTASEEEVSKVIACIAV